MHQQEVNKLEDYLTFHLGEAAADAWDHYRDDAAVTEVMGKLLKDYDVEKALKDYAEFRAEKGLV